MARRSFRGKVVLVTGGAAGIGLATARRFAEAGARIVLMDTDETTLYRCREDFKSDGTSIAVTAGDVRSMEDCRAAADLAVSTFGGIDVLFNNAGITQRGAFADTDLSVYRRVMEVNFFGALHSTRAAFRSIVERRGMIIANESIAGVAPLLGRTGYSASKHAMHGLFTSLRTELQNTGVHVMIVCPGFVQTGLQQRALGPDGRPSGHPQSFVGTKGTPENVAEAVYRGAVRERRLLVLTPVGKAGYWMSRLAPALYERQMARRLKAELAYPHPES